MDLKNKKVLITGASSGIGQAIAIEFAKKGATIFINYRSNEKGAKETLERVNEYSQGEIFKANLEKKNDVKKMIQRIIKKYKNIDILVNNAANYKAGDLNDFNIWQGQFNGILMTAVYATSEFLNNTKGKRKIINISSIYGTLEKSSLVHPHYSAMKAALSSLTTTLAKKYSHKNITVNAIAPGWTWTPAWEGTPVKRQKEIFKKVSINRFIKSEEIAHTCIYLAENDAINGQIIMVDGGLFMELV